MTEFDITSAANDNPTEVIAQQKAKANVWVIAAIYWLGKYWLAVLGLIDDGTSPEALFEQINAERMRVRKAFQDHIWGEETWMAANDNGKEWKIAA